MGIDDHTASYASVPMAYPGQGTLLSDWPSAFTNRTHRQVLPPDPEIMKNVKMSGNLGYAKVPESGVRKFPYAVNEASPHVRVKPHASGRSHDGRSKK